MTTAMVGNWLAPCLTVENGSQLAPDPRSHSFHAIVAYRLDVQSIMIATSSAPLDQELFNRQADAIAEAGKYVAGHGWTPATSSNFSARLDDSRIAVTISGRDKGKLGREDIMVVDYQGSRLAASTAPARKPCCIPRFISVFPKRKRFCIPIHASRASLRASTPPRAWSASKDGSCKRPSPDIPPMKV